MRRDRVASCDRMSAVLAPSSRRGYFLLRAAMIRAGRNGSSSKGVVAGPDLSLRETGGLRVKPRVGRFISSAHLLAEDRWNMATETAILGFCQPLPIGSPALGEHPR